MLGKLMGKTKFNIGNLYASLGVLDRTALLKIKLKTLFYLKVFKAPLSVFMSLCSYHR